MFRSQANKHNWRRSLPLPLALAAYDILANNFGGLKVPACWALAESFGPKRGNRYAKTHEDMVEDRRWCNSCVARGTVRPGKRWPPCSGLFGCLERQSLNALLGQADIVLQAKRLL